MDVPGERYNKIVKPADAAREYWETLDAVKAHAATQRRHDAAVKALKTHMAEQGITLYQGITLVETDGGSRLDQAAAMAALGDRLAAFLKPTVRRSLVPAKRPKKFEAAAA